MDLLGKRVLIYPFWGWWEILFISQRPNARNLNKGEKGWKEWENMHSRIEEKWIVWDICEGSWAHGEKDIKGAILCNFEHQKGESLLK